MEDLVSVIIPTYKRPFEMLSRAIKSVLAQSYTNIEVIVVDDSPSSFQDRDRIKRQVGEISDDRIIYIQHEFNQGACAARNTGIRNAKGDFIAFLDDDDEWLPDKLKLQLDRMRETGAGLVYCASYTITLQDGKEIKKTIRNNTISGWVYDKLIINNFIGSTSFVLLKREVLESCGGFNNEMKSAQDYELWLRISKKYKVNYVGTPLVNYYVHENERISTNIDNKIDGLEKLNELNMKYLKSNPKVMAIRKLKIIPYYRIKCGRYFALRKWFEAFRIYPFQLENVKYLLKVLKK